MMLPKCVLPSNKRAGKKQNLPSIEKICDRWEKGDHLALWIDAKETAEKAKPLNTKQTTDQQQRDAQLDAALAAAADGQYGRACRILTSTGIAPNTERTWNLLKCKHPQAPKPEIDKEGTEAVQLESGFNMIEAIRSFPKDTACGPSGLRAQHLIEAQEAQVPVSIATQLRHVVNILLRGAAPGQLSPFIAGASLTALKKPNDDIRPIASGEILRRLTSKCACTKLKIKAARFFEPLQFGVACPGGVEKVTHRLRKVIEEHWLDEDFVVFKVDMYNAFNTMDRQLIMNECKHHFPELLAWTKSCYGEHPKLWHVLGSLFSELGVQQGDQLGPLIFALALHSVVNDIDAACELLLHCWYLDDGVFCGKRSEIEKVLEILTNATAVTGLSVKLSKCELYSRSDLSCFPEAIEKKYHEPNLQMLGAPIGSAEFCRNIIAEKAKESNELLSKLPELGNPQVSTILLRTCASFCKLSHLARSVPPDVSAPALKKFDDSVRKCFEESVVINATDRAWTQAQLPIRFGGFGLRSLENHCSPAFIASHKFSMGAAFDAQKLESALEIFNSRIGDHEPLSSTSELIRQKPLSDLIDEHSFHELEETCTLAEKVKLTSLTEPHNGDWIRAQPSEALGLGLSPNEFNVLTKWRLGLEIFPSNQTCPLCPNETLDQFAQHALTCKRGPDVCRRHNGLRNSIADYCRRAQLNPILEAGAGFRDQTRPADVLVPTWNLGKDAALDITVVNPLNDTNIDGAIAIRGSAAAAAASRKHGNNDAKCRKLGWECLPMVVTCYGEWGSEAIAFLDRLASRVAMQTATSTPEMKNAIYTRLSCLLMRSNAQAMLSRGGQITAGRMELSIGGDPSA